MRMSNARKEVEDFVSKNKGKIDDALYEKKLSDLIIDLSHRIYKEYSSRGHLIRQQIRKELREFSIGVSNGNIR